MDNESLARVEDREAHFWDQATESVSDHHLASETVRDQPLHSSRKELLGDLKDKKVLDVGCGTGLWAAYLASQGAEVWAIDISPHSVALTQRRAELNGVEDRVHAEVTSATETAFPDSFFDVVHGQDIIHHLDPTLFGQEVERILKPGGYAVFEENSANNPVLMFCRNNLCGRFGIPKWSSGDEYPLRQVDRRRFAMSFESASVSYPEFLFFMFLDAKLFRFKYKLISRITQGLDNWIYKLPALRRYSYRQLIRCDKQLRRAVRVDQGASLYEPKLLPRALR